MDIYEDHAKSLTDSVRLTRRGFAVTSLAAGFAAAVSPSASVVIVAWATGLMAAAKPAQRLVTAKPRRLSRTESLRLLA